ncbi:RNA methyltransferase [Kangiella sp. TOML190]|uniref:RNA methyltransferase n=1 Tax=Kangiella sp. TOML190 TaxID=2931351 RepID=UPI00203AC546|nr:RNA methyltransferase [Kangiella sp. TOML190]
MLDQIKIVLCHTSHPGNIGAAARAMKTMGLYQLVLVNPKDFPCEEALVRSSGALDILDSALVVETVEEAIKDCKLVIGTSSRNRALPWPLIEPREMAQLIDTKPESHPVAILFGRESVGLLNEELQLCHYHVNIPANPDYMSLNLASAVQIISYELRLKHLTQNPITEAPLELKDSELVATSEQVEGLYQHLEQTMVKTEFFDPENPKLLSARIRRLFAKSQLNQGEVNILRGFLSSIEKYIKRKTK